MTSPPTRAVVRLTPADGRFADYVYASMMRIQGNALRSPARAGIALLVFLTGTVATAGVGVWTTNGPAGATNPANVVTDPQESGTVYAGSPQGVFKSTDGGQTWSSVFGQAASPLAAGPAGTVYVVANYVQLLKSTDGGGTWTSLLTLTNDRSISFLTIDPQTPTTIYRVDTLDTAISVQSGVSRSTDGGRTWTPADQGLDGNKITALVADPKTAGTAFVASMPVGFSALPPGSIFKTIDGGSTWTLLTKTLGPNLLLALDPITPTNVYAASIYGVFKSTDGGATFAPLSSALATQNAFVTGLVIDSHRPNRLYAGTSIGVYASYDGGVTWTPISNGFSGTSPLVTAFAIDSTGTHLHAVTSGQGVFDYQINSGSCTADAHTLCLNNGRFSVTSTFQQTPEGPSASASAVSLTNSTGYFWFFAPANIELVVKVLTGCSVNGSYWVFAGGLTDVGVEMKVTDTVTGEAKSYSNTFGTPYQPIQDSSAFSCPPADVSLAGSWRSMDFGRICVGDWHSVTLTLQQSGTNLTGEITTVDGMQFAVTGSIQGGIGDLHIAFPDSNEGMCTSIALSVSQVSGDSTGQAVSFSGEATGRCCGTVFQQYQFSRSPAR